MTTTLAATFAEAAKLPFADQEIFAAWILEELTAERRWAQLFASHSDKLLTLALEALEEDAQGRSLPLDVEEL